MPEEREQPTPNEVRKQSAYEGRPSPDSSGTEAGRPTRPAGGQDSDAGNRIEADPKAVRETVVSDAFEGS